MINIKISEIFKRKDIIRFLKFLLVGGTVFIANTTLLWILKRKIYLGNEISITIAYVISAGVHFILNNFFTFKDSDAAYKRRIVGYTMTIICNYIITTLVGNVVLRYIIDNVLAATIASTAATTIFSFLILNKIVYVGSKRGG